MSEEREEKKKKQTNDNNKISMKLRAVYIVSMFFMISLFDETY